MTKKITRAAVLVALATVHGEGKLGLRNILAAGIENKLFTELEYPWKPNDLLEINKDEISKYLVQLFYAV